MTVPFFPGQRPFRAIDKGIEFSANDFIGADDKLSRIDGGYNISLFALQFDINVAQSATSALDAINTVYNLITSLTLKLGGHYVYQGITGAQLRYLHMATGALGADQLAVAKPTGLPGTSANADFLVTIPLLWPDVYASLGAEHWRWPSELVREMELLVSTGAQTVVDADATVTGNVRVVAWADGAPGADMYMAPLPKYHSFGDAVSQQKRLGLAGHHLRCLYAVDTSGFAAHATEKDKLFMGDGTALFYHEDTTIQDLLDNQYLLEQIASQGNLNRNASTGAQTGITDTTFAFDNVIRYIDGRCDLGDSFTNREENPNFEPASSRALRAWFYRKIDQAFIMQTVQKIKGIPTNNIQALTHVRGQYQPIDLVQGTALPVYLGARS